jgi:oligosaccharide repeat unit polymerase
MLIERNSAATFSPLTAYLLRAVTIAMVAVLALLTAQAQPSYAPLYAYAAITIVLPVVYRSDILHPLVWFPIFFALYTLFFPLSLLLLQGELDPIALKAIDLSLYGLVGFCLGVAMVGAKPISYPRVILQPFISTSKTLVACAVCWFGTAVYLVAAVRSGATTKRELVDAAASGSPMLRLGPFFVLLTLFAVLYLQRRWSEQRPSTWFLAAALVWFAIGMLVSGQRDYLFRFLVSVFFLFHASRRRIPLWAFVVCIMLGVVAMPITQASKGLLLGNPFALDVQALELFAGEFSNAGRNLYVILVSEPNPFNGTTFVWDLQRVFALNVLGGESVGTSEWFNRRYRVEEGIAGTSGWGFSIVAEGYINYGAFGVFATLFFMGAVSGWLYRRSPRSACWLVGYILYISAATYSIRADMANFVSPNLKFVLVPMLFIYVMSQTRVRPLRIAPGAA